MIFGTVLVKCSNFNVAEAELDLQSLWTMWYLLVYSKLDINKPKINCLKIPSNHSRQHKSVRYF